jgi:starch synthase
MADAITTVSPRYAQEIQTPGMGHGLDGVLRARARHLTGILNGVDYGEWNPETDPHLAANYSAADLAGKRDCKRELLREFALPDDNLERPLVGIVSRFAEQKGFDLVAGIAQEIADGDLQLAVLGTGDWRYERMFRDWAAWLPHKVGAWIGYNNAIAHKIEAGADMFLMPSHYEPCGLNQIYSLKYGTVPIVRATGGLDDTVDETTGFKFEHYSADGLVWALRQALAEYSTDRTGWRARQVRGMRKDFSWHASALQYSDLYQRLLA